VRAEKPPLTEAEKAKIEIQRKMSEMEK